MWCPTLAAHIHSCDRITMWQVYISHKNWRYLLIISSALVISAFHCTVLLLNEIWRRLMSQNVNWVEMTHTRTHAHTHTRLTALCPGLPGWAGTRKVKPIWILLKQETVSGSGISWAVCKSAPRCRQITMPAPHHSVFTGRMLFLSPNQQRQSTEGMWVEMTVTGNLTPDNLQFLSWRKAEQQDSA